MNTICVCMPVQGQATPTFEIVFESPKYWNIETLLETISGNKFLNHRTLKNIGFKSIAEIHV